MKKKFKLVVRDSMSVRDQFAMIALGAIVSKSPWVVSKNRGQYLTAMSRYRSASLGAYAYADEMMRARAGL